MNTELLKEDEREMHEWLGRDYRPLHKNDCYILLERLAEEREKNAELEGTLPGRMKGCQAVADEKCRWFLERAEKAEAELAEARNELHTCDDVVLNKGLTFGIASLRQERDCHRDRAGKAESELASARWLYNEAAGELRRTLAELAEARKDSPSWISVKDRLPDMNSRKVWTFRIGYRVAEENGIDIDTAQNQACWHSIRNGRSYGITHWMEALKPPVN